MEPVVTEALTVSSKETWDDKINDLIFHVLLEMCSHVRFWYSTETCYSKAPLPRGLTAEEGAL